MLANHNRSSLWYNLYGSIISFILCPFLKIRLKFWFSVTTWLTLIRKLAAYQNINQRSSLSFFQDYAHLYSDSSAGQGKGEDSWIIGAFLQPLPRDSLKILSTEKNALLKVALVANYWYLSANEVPSWNCLLEMRNLNQRHSHVDNWKSDP